MQYTIRGIPAAIDSALRERARAAGKFGRHDVDDFDAFNTDLARKPRVCLEYLVVHEMAHLIEPTHNARFMAIMDRAMPQWRFVRDQLNRLPVRHEEWTC